MLFIDIKSTLHESPRLTVRAHVHLSAPHPKPWENTLATTLRYDDSSLMRHHRG